MYYRSLLLLLCLLFLSLGSEAKSLSLHIQGSNTIGAQLMPELVRAWLVSKAYTSITLDRQSEQSRLQARGSDGNDILVEIQAQGSSTAFQGLKQGQAELGMASRRIKAQEIEQLAPLGAMTSLANEHVIALDGIAVIIHPDNPLSKLDKAQIRDIFTGKLSNWKQVGGEPGVIRLHARDDQSGTYDVFRTLVLDKATGLSPSATRYAENRVLSDAVAADPQGIGFVSLPYILRAKAVAIADGEAPAIAPSRFSVATEDYALSRRLYLYVTDQQVVGSLARELVEFAHSDAAQEIIAKTGFISQQVFSEGFPLDQDYPQEMRELTQGAQRLSVNMRFAEKTVFLDNKAKRDADRVYRFLEQSGKLQSGLMLFGFAEMKPGGMSTKSFNRSVRRADQVGKYLRDKGVWVMTSRGYGGIAPVASNDSALGQEKNRRVELWLK
jgi:phosphate transport system substrate-binding protein